MYICIVEVGIVENLIVSRVSSLTFPAKCVVVGLTLFIICYYLKASVLCRVCCVSRNRASFTLSTLYCFGQVQL